MPAWLLPVATSLLGASLFGGEGQGSAEQRRLMGAQASIAELMNSIMANRNQLTGPNMVNGQLQGPMVEALMSALSNAQQVQARPRTMVENTTPFDPYGPLRQQLAGRGA